MPIDPRIWGFSPDMGDLGDTLAGGITSFMKNRDYNNAVKDATLPDGSIDYEKLQDNLVKVGQLERIGEIEGYGVGDERFFAQPYFDQEGNPWQFGNRGNPRKVELPSGVRIQEPRTFVQTPQSVYERGRFTGTQYGETPKNYAGPEEQKELGDVAGKAKAALPAAEGMAKRVIGAIERVEKNPELKNAVGLWQGRMPTLFNQDVANIEADIEQAIGGTFTSVYESLRGAQAITDVEGEKATNAITRLQNFKQSDEQYPEALKDAKYEVFELQNTVRKKAGLDPLPNPYRVPRGTPDLTTGKPLTARRVPTMRVSPDGSMTPTTPPPVTTDLPSNINGGELEAIAKARTLLERGVPLQRVIEALRADGISEEALSELTGGQ